MAGGAQTMHALHTELGQQSTPLGLSGQCPWDSDTASVGACRVYLRRASIAHLVLARGRPPIRAPRTRSSTRQSTSRCTGAWCSQTLGLRLTLTLTLTSRCTGALPGVLNLTPTPPHPDPAQPNPNPNPSPHPDPSLNPSPNPDPNPSPTLQARGAQPAADGPAARGGGGGGGGLGARRRGQVWSRPRAVLCLLVRAGRPVDRRHRSRRVRRLPGGTARDHHRAAAGWSGA